MVRPDKNKAVQETLTTQKGGPDFDMASWEEIPREDLLRFLQEMVQSAPRAVAEAWRDNYLLPLLALKEQEGGLKTPA